ncbi:hypothetical protein NIES4071_46790 [Calothrix sp. NIES-4071]|nr:hypothetical protein NIES4071_46790 [Calothrix sp. NIES-4071]BAZ58990.1 hypothetical protein NIES4105_46720 [Calothrix sp. NIES-4105]
MKFLIRERDSLLSRCQSNLIYYTLLVSGAHNTTLNYTALLPFCGMANLLPYLFSI